LLPALMYQFDQFSVHTHIKVNFFYQGLDRAFTPEVKITVYHVTEEILQNVARHAQVDKVTVGMWMDGTMLQIEIEDQGVGFDLESMYGERIASGLIEIRERIATLGGELKIMSSYGTGVRVHAVIPCPEVPAENSLDNLLIGNPLGIASISHTEISPNAVGTVRVLVAEENVIVRQGLLRLLETDFHIMGEVSERDQIVSAIQELQPDVLILGATIAGVSTLDQIPPALKAQPGLRVLIFSSNPSDIYAYEALRHGASGYLRNNASAAEIREAVTMIGRGDEYWSASLQEESLRRRVEIINGNQTEIDNLTALTLREREILVMVAEGYTSRQIAEKLSISPRTAETHRSNIARKLGLRTQAELIHYAIKHGLIQPET
ncbi:MAG TPA: LuxR C-terminal-related transcriptional regulator, partial [Phototrophicaceae bacterium]|nr:LuxR C-terminal-related transcriptional regulator [Phototrophicaceae bacterium]